MKRYFTRFKLLHILATGLLLWSCDKTTDDVVPNLFKQFKIYPDEIYTVNSNTGYILRLDPLSNDSIKTEVTVTYTQPKHGQLLPDFDGPGTMGYKPEQRFFGTDSLNHTVCADKNCQTEVIKLIVETPQDPATCVTVLTGETLETTVNKSKQLRIFLNDVICYNNTYGGTTIYKPEKGTFETIEYAGSYKNTIYVYIPPKDYTSQDSFRYRVCTSQDRSVYQEITVPVTIR